MGRDGNGGSVPACRVMRKVLAADDPGGMDGSAVERATDLDQRGWVVHDKPVDWGVRVACSVCPDCETSGIRDTSLLVFGACLGLNAKNRGSNPNRTPTVIRLGESGGPRR